MLQAKVQKHLVQEIRIQSCGPAHLLQTTPPDMKSMKKRKVLLLALLAAVLSLVVFGYLLRRYNSLNWASKSTGRWIFYMVPTSSLLLT